MARPDRRAVIELDPGVPQVYGGFGAEVILVEAASPLVSGEDAIIARELAGLLRPPGPGR